MFHRDDEQVAETIKRGNIKRHAVQRRVIPLRGGKRVADSLENGDSCTTCKSELSLTDPHPITLAVLSLSLSL